MKDNQTGIKSGTTLTQKHEMRPLYFARDKADKRPSLEQCKEMSEYLRKTGFDTYAMTSNENHLIFYGKEIDNA